MSELYEEVFRTVVGLHTWWKEYIENVNRSLNADQLKETNVIAERLLDVDFKVVPTCLSSELLVGVQKLSGDQLMLEMTN